MHVQRSFCRQLAGAHLKQLSERGVALPGRKYGHCLLFVYSLQLKGRSLNTVPTGAASKQVFHDP